MIDEIIASGAFGPMHVALRESGRLMELLIENSDEPGAVGDIIVGRVTAIMKGMEACFVDIGGDKAGFLSLAARGAADAESFPAPTEGAAVLVQVTKAAQMGKGPGLTRSLSLAGRFLVLTPYQPRIAVSRRIGDEAARARVEAILRSLAAEGEGEGFIVRTAAAEASAEALEEDARSLRARWHDIAARVGNCVVPSRLHGEGSGLVRVLRDRAHADIRRVLVDEPRAADEARAFFAEYLPGLERRVELWSGIDPLFDAFGIEDDIADALEPEVSLPCGGSVVIEHTHALTAIDVNTGRNTGRSSHAATVHATNLEAAAEIARQLRLRSVGGLTVIDFVHMDNAEDREDVLDVLLDALADDPAFIRATGFSELGLVELARRRGAGPLVARLAAARGGDGSAG
jgi:ribonuclease G